MTWGCEHCASTDVIFRYFLDPNYSGSVSDWLDENGDELRERSKEEGFSYAYCFACAERSKAPNTKGRRQKRVHSIGLCKV